MSGSGFSWAICKSAPRSRQITTPVPHHSVFYRPDALPAAQPTASKHWRQALVNLRYNNNNNNNNNNGRPVAHCFGLVVEWCLKQHSFNSSYKCNPSRRFSAFNRQCFSGQHLGTVIWEVFCGSNSEDWLFTHCFRSGTQRLVQTATDIYLKHICSCDTNWCIQHIKVSWR